MSDMIDAEMIEIPGFETKDIKDKNQKEIYEGDLIRATPSDYAPHEIYQVIWDADHLRWELPLPIGDYVVIGNIYENPELPKAVH